MSLTAFVLIAATLPGAPAQKQKSVRYLPVKVGTKLIYADSETPYAPKGENALEKTVTQTWIVNAVEETKDGLMATIDVTHEKEALFFSIQIRHTSDGMFSREKGKPKTEERVLKLPLIKGDKWDKTRPDTNGDQASIKISFTVVGEEKVEVEAGTFTATRVNSTSERGGFNFNVSYWYVPEIGLVKRTSNSVIGNHSLTLKSLTVGKDDKE